MSPAYKSVGYVGVAAAAVTVLKWHLDYYNIAMPPEVEDAAVLLGAAALHALEALGTWAWQTFQAYFPPRVVSVVPRQVVAVPTYPAQAAK